jgi:hypothetical protein
MKIEGLEVKEEEVYIDIGYTGQKMTKRKLSEIADKTLSEIMELLEEEE